MIMKKSLIIIGLCSGIMAENLSEGNSGVALLGNTIATGAILFVIIKMFGSISGAHFNPAVTMMFLLRKELDKKDSLIYCVTQVSGGLLAIIVTHLLVTLPFAIWMMRGFFIDLPLEIEEAARVDGCSKWQVLWRIALPLAAPGIAVTALFCFIFSWNEFVFALVLSRKEAITLPVVIAGTRTQFGIHWPIMTAMSAMSCLPVFFLALVAQKYLVRGMTLGAVK